MSVQTATDLRFRADSFMLPRTEQVLGSVGAWWATKASQAGLTGKWTDVTQALSALPPAELPQSSLDDVGADVTPEMLGQLYVNSLPGGERSKEGKHYTPAVLAERLWEMTREALGFTRGRDRLLPGLVRDPACGAGALLLPPLREHLRASSKVDPAITIRGLGSKIYGIDRDPWSAWLTNVVLGAEALSTLARVPEGRRSPLPVMAESGDGLASGRAKALATVMNPPYGRLRLTEAVRSDFAHVLYGHANIYGMFMAAGACEVQDDGVLACLVPTSFTAGRYFHKLRGHMAKTMPMHSMNFVEGRTEMFAGVLQETCLVTFRRKATRKVKVTRSNGHVEAVAEVPVPRGDGPWLLPRESMDAGAAAAAAKMPLTLFEAGWHASTGPLVWNRRKDDLFPRSGKNRVVILWGADIEGGTVHRDAARDGMRYLVLSVKSDPEVMVLDQPAILVQRTTAPEQSRRLVSAELTQDTLDGFGGRVVIENHLNVLRPVTDAPLISRTTLAKVLQTPTMDRILRCISGSVAVSSYEIDSLPLPAAHVLTSWETLSEDELETAVAAAYRPGVIL
jgi:adenine-specific DNA-methyltransferase